MCVAAAALSAAPAERTTVLNTDELAWLRPITESLVVAPPGELGIKRLIRHFARQEKQRFPRPVIEALTASVLRFEQPSIYACRGITMKLVAWCLFHRVEASLDTLDAMRVDALRSVGLDSDNSGDQ